MSKQLMKSKRVSGGSSMMTLGVVMGMLLIQTVLGEECFRKEIGRELPNKAILRSCSGWALNRLPQVKGWINNQAPKAYPDNVEIKYMGGDPRIVIVRTQEEICYNEQGDTINIEMLEILSNEYPIKSFNEE